ncbi:hypothetical protein GCM10007875_12240 [Limnobacter litoralis]|uniref:Uncharacterized protein n=1 Tax=Limnobacter litoralis TaxID=481366 RepID=A0ABQ5YRR8_9BURK|nr:hypothetical protein GCM10007875_12240 [Limnobacter litoralis]
MPGANPIADQVSNPVNSAVVNSQLTQAVNLAEMSNNLAKMLYEDQKNGQGQRFDQLFPEMKKSLEAVIDLLQATRAGVSSGLQSSGLIETKSSSPASVKVAVQRELNNVLSEIDGLNLPKSFVHRLKQSAKVAAEELSKKESIESGSINSSIKCRSLSLLSEERLDDVARQWLDEIKTALPDEHLTTARHVASKIQTIRADGFFKLLSCALTPLPVQIPAAPANARDAAARAAEARAGGRAEPDPVLQPTFRPIDDFEVFADSAEEIRHQTKQLLNRELPTELAAALDLDGAFQEIDAGPLSDLGAVLRNRLEAADAPDAPEALKNHMADVKSISQAIGNSPGIPDTLFDAQILNNFVNAKALDLAFHQKTRATEPEVYENELTKISEEALHKAMVGRIGRDMGLDANRTNAIKNFISELQMKGASATGNTSAAVHALKQATEIFGKGAVASYAKWGMSQSQRRNAIAQSVVGYVQYLTGSSDEASGLIKQMIKKPASGQPRPGNGQLTDEASRQLEKLGQSLVDLVDPKLNVHRNSELESVFRNLVEGSLVASGVDSHSVQRAREPGKQVQKPIVLTARSMAVKEAENPTANNGILNKITRIGLPVMRDDTAGRALKIQRTLQANIAKSLLFHENRLTLDRVNEMIEQSTSCAQLYQIGLLVAVAAGERRLATRAGTALLEKSFDFEKRSAVGAKVADKQVLRDSVLFLMRADGDSLSAGLHNELNRQVTVGGAYSANGVSDQEKRSGKVDPFTLRRTARKEAQNEILDRVPEAEPEAAIPAPVPPVVPRVVPQRQGSRIVEMSRFNGLMRRTIQTVFENPLPDIPLSDEHQTALRANLLRQLTEGAAADRFDLSQADEDGLYERMNRALNVLLPEADEFTKEQLNVELTSTFMRLKETR